MISGKSLKTIDIVMVSILAVLALFIWFRDLSWISTADDTLPILVAIPLFFWIAAPWKFREDSEPMSVNLIALSVLFFLIGIGLNFTFSLTLGWTILLWTWLKTRVVPEMLPSIKKLLVLPMMAFPWIALDAVKIGWWFRLSGAWAAAEFFSLIHLDVTREGTLMVVNGVAISVEVACAGLNTLQSMMIAGSIVDYLLLGNSVLYWWNLPLLVAISWLANTLRIILISLAALYVSPQFATGEFHTIGGWAILMFMFGICWFIFSLQAPKEEKAK